MAAAPKKATPSLAPSSTTIGQIERQVSDQRTQLAMSLGALLEGGTLAGSGFGVGDNGNSHGPFQINAPFHPDISVAGALNPASAVAYMKGAYQSAVNQISPSLWSSNPELAAEQAARMAENPAQDYITARGQSTVDSAYQRATAALGGAPVGGGGGSSSGGGITATNASFLSSVGGLLTNPLGALSGAAADTGNAIAGGVVAGAEALAKPFVSYLEDAVLVVFGLIFVLVGLHMITSGASTDVVNSVVNGGRKASSGEDEESGDGEDEEEESGEEAAPEAAEVAAV